MKRLLKEREAIKRKLEMNEQMRRSSMGRPSCEHGLAVTCKFFLFSHHGCQVKALIKSLEKIKV